MLEVLVELHRAGDDQQNRAARSEQSTHIELVIGGGLDRSVSGERLDDLDGFVELGFGHGE